MDASESTTICRVCYTQKLRRGRVGKVNNMNTVLIAAAEIAASIQDDRLEKLNIVVRVIPAGENRLIGV